MRSAATPGDTIWVSGPLGDAGLALAHHSGDVRPSSAQRARCEAALNPAESSPGAGRAHTRYRHRRHRSGIARELGLACIGVLSRAPALHIEDEAGQQLEPLPHAFDHFAE